MGDQLSRLVTILENLDLNFAKNWAENDDAMSDAYQYLMRHFPIESGKSKGQFYMPSKVSGSMAKVIGINGSPSCD